MKQGHSMFSSLPENQKEAIMAQAIKKIPGIPPNPNGNTKVTLKAHGQGWSVNVRAIFIRGPRGTNEIVVIDSMNHDTVILAHTEKPTQGISAQTIPSKTAPSPMQVTA